MSNEIILLIFLILWICIQQKSHWKSGIYSSLDDRHKGTHIDKELILKNSNVEGIGIFTKEGLKQNERIFDGINNNGITRVGSLINHSWNANTHIEKEGADKYGIYASKPIKSGSELLLNYNDQNLPHWVAPANLNWK